MNEILKHTLKLEALILKLIELPFIYLLILHTQVLFVLINNIYFRWQKKNKDHIMKIKVEKHTLLSSPASISASLLFPVCPCRWALPFFLWRSACGKKRFGYWNILIETVACFKCSELSELLGHCWWSFRVPRTFSEG